MPFAKIHMLHIIMLSIPINNTIHNTIFAQIINVTLHVEANLCCLNIILSWLAHVNRLPSYVMT